MKKLAIAFIAVIALSACQKQAEDESTVGTGGIKVEKLFTHDRCTVYRFYDGRTVYYTDCRGAASWSESYPCGKAAICTRKVDVPTSVQE